MSIVIGMDIGGTSVKLGAWDGEQRVAWQSGLEVPDTADEHAIADCLAGYISDFTTPLDTPAAVGVGSCGLISGGVIFQSPNTPWNSLALVALLGHRLNFPAYLINDADAFLVAALTTLAETRCVAIGVTLGTGVGTAIWIQDRLFHGGAGISPEGGHITLGIDRAPANTGVPGSWESLAGRHALLRYYEQAGGAGKPDPVAIAAAARNHDPASIAAWLRYGRYVGAGLGSLCNVLSPDYVLVGGGMAEAHDLFEPAMQAAIDRHMLREMPRPDVHFMDDGADVVAHGAARHARMMVSSGKG